MARSQGKESGMPLSEDEQRILSEIEESLKESDPALAREVSETTVYTHAFRNLKWAALSLLVGVVVMVMSLSVTYLLSFVGFLMMLASLLWLERSVRRLGRVGFEQMTSGRRGNGLRDLVGGASERMRGRFGRPGDDQPR